MASNFGNLTAFRAIFLAKFSLHVRLFMNFLHQLPVDSMNPIFLWSTIFRWFQDVFCWFCIG